MRPRSTHTSPRPFIVTDEQPPLFELPAAPDDFAVADTNAALASFDPTASLVPVVDLPPGVTDLAARRRAADVPFALFVDAQHV